ncbi:MAG TPA: carboxypeptidase regulatory-like domain-containing protein [Fimbriiglobus sp.]|nr:carboxypeptidase regulatory-like domain-containing protein [Fimbriiglobus sp.]
MKRTSVWGLSVMVVAAGLFAAVGCGDTSPGDVAGSAPPDQQQAAKRDKPAATAAATPAKTTAAAPVDIKPAAGTATIVGKVRYSGEPPKRKPINFGPEKKCCDAHKTPPLDDTLVVSPDREVQWVLVRIAGKVPGNYPPPSQPAVIDQHGCIFSPHVLPVLTGQEIEIRNGDEVLHNVRGEAILNPPFNRNLPKAADPLKLKFSTAEVGVKVKCDVHFWMGGYIHVMPHPFFAVTGEDGAFAINQVPPGTYKLETWHEKLGKQAQEITVKDGEVKTVDFTYPPK